MKHFHHKNRTVKFKSANSTEMAEFYSTSDASMPAEILPQPNSTNIVVPKSPPPNSIDMAAPTLLKTNLHPASSTSSAVQMLPPVWIQ